ncbi:MAG: homoserine O-succinyltransferase [Alphaproteobacteria bacterium]|nr:homoserine O-succinyltransferase [Alphaproteobacteria bacterium]
MPVIITSHERHPFLPSLGNPSAIDRKRAVAQDVRPMEIAILNLMADKQTTERQLAQWLGNTPLQVQLTFVATDSYINKIRGGHSSKNTAPEHIQKFYHAFGEIKDRKFDGLIVTGVNALKDRVEEELIWGEVCELLEWSRTNVLSTLFLCWGAKAALKYFYDIDSLKGNRKTFGLFEHRLVSDKTGVLFGFPDAFSVPVSRWKSPCRDDIQKVKALEIIADSIESGPNMLAESRTFDDGESFYPRRLYVLNHPEYETDTLHREYLRDRAKDPLTALPEHYYPENDPVNPPLNSWRYSAILYTNWIKCIYAAVPFDISQIPGAYHR